MLTRRRQLLGLALLFALGCTSTRAPDPNAVHAQCPVCKHEGDLACVDVVVDPQTPHATFGGRTYYFCSDDCRTRFERRPSDYVASER
jgi:YHS domain-containing protein